MEHFCDLYVVSCDVTKILLSFLVLYETTEKVELPGWFRMFAILG